MNRTHIHEHVQEKMSIRRKLSIQKKRQLFYFWKIGPRGRKFYKTQFEKQEGLCAICRQPLDQTRLSIDHIVPLYLGGTNEESNLQLTHRLCNSIKTVM